MKPTAQRLIVLKIDATGEVTEVCAAAGGEWSLEYDGSGFAFASHPLVGWKWVNYVFAKSVWSVHNEGVAVKTLGSDGSEIVEWLGDTQKRGDYSYAS